MMRDREPEAALQLLVGVVSEAIDTEATFNDWFSATPNHFWLDSSRIAEGLSRFSFLGDASGPLSEVLTYRVDDGSVRVSDASGARTETGSIFEILGQRLRHRRIADPGLPFAFTGGYVGYFGYEMKADCGAQSPHTAEGPDAAWIFADRLVAVDHQAKKTYVLAIHDGPAGRAPAEEWILRVTKRLAEIRRPERVSCGPPYESPHPQDYLVRDEDGYQADVQECLRQLARGESYEICLTNKLRLPFDEDDAVYYGRLRRANPAPYAALLRIDGATVFSSSPERFLRIEPDGTVESKPIKGTAPRSADSTRDAELAADLAADPKTQAENLMIVDLLRNDLGRVCEVGSVTVPSYMAVESYATVHQLVSTVTGTLRPEVEPVDCVRQCFPGGSMTGAPKLRTMEIIDRLETEARGVYSGALGYFGLAGGADLSIVIRTAVRMGDDLSIGAGGAIVLDSDPVEEYEEMLLKASAPMRAWRSRAGDDAQAVRATDAQLRLRWAGQAKGFTVAHDIGEIKVVDSWLTSEGCTRRLELHAERFSRACHTLLAVPTGLTRAFLAAALEQVPARGDWFPRAELALVGDEPRLQLWLRRPPTLGESVVMWVAPDPDCRVRPDIKGPDLDYLAGLRRRAISAGADESLLLSADGRVREGSTTSIMWWDGDTLYSAPEAPDIFPSVTRSLLLKVIAASGVHVAFKRPMPHELDGLEVWAVNALHGIRPVVRWVGASITAGPAPHADRWNAELVGLARSGGSETHPAVPGTRGTA